MPKECPDCARARFASGGAIPKCPFCEMSSADPFVTDRQRKSPPQDSKSIGKDSGIDTVVNGLRRIRCLGF